MEDIQTSQNKVLKFEIFYVGDGDCTLIEFPGNQIFGIIDSHKPSWLDRSPVAKVLEHKIKRQIESKKNNCIIPEIEFICVSRPHIDHVNGLLELLDIEGINIKEFWHTLPDLEEFLLKHVSHLEDEKYNLWTELCQMYYEDQIEEFVIFGNQILNLVGKENVRQLRGMEYLPEIEGVELYVLSPSRKSLIYYKDILAENFGRFEYIDRSLLDTISVAIIFAFGENAFLYASDMQELQWRDAINSLKKRKRWKNLLPLNVMKASHHGGPNSFYNDLWSDILGVDNGQIVVSGGSMTHPHESFIRSIESAKKDLYCTGLAKMCGRDQQSIEIGTYHTKQWLQRFGMKYSDYEHPCCGDISVILPETGDIEISTTHWNNDCIVRQHNILNHS